MAWKGVSGEIAICNSQFARAVPVGDFHLPSTVAYALAGEERADDARMLDLLEEFRPHRGRVVQLLNAAHVVAPKYGPRPPIRTLEDR